MIIIHAIIIIHTSTLLQRYTHLPYFSDTYVYSSSIKPKNRRPHTHIYVFSKTIFRCVGLSQQAILSIFSLESTETTEEHRHVAEMNLQGQLFKELLFSVPTHAQTTNAEPPFASFQHSMRTHTSRTSAPDPSPITKPSLWQVYRPVRRRR